MRAAISAAAAVLAVGACSRTPEVGPEPPSFEPEGQTKCGVRASTSKPLIVEWPSAERGALEARSREGAVVVRYANCEMEVLPRCAVPATYHFQPFTPKRDNVVIHSEDELWARVPVGAARLEGKLARYGQLTVAMTMVGQYALDDAAVARNALAGDCGGATHVVSAVTVGAFEFFAGAGTEAGGGIEVGGLGGGAKATRGRETLTRDGDPNACATTGAASGPPLQCGAFIRIEVTPLVAVAPNAPAAGTAPLPAIEREPFVHDEDTSSRWREVPGS